jgi:hypothetical protein
MSKYQPGGPHPILLEIMCMTGAALCISPTLALLLIVPSIIRIPSTSPQN